MSITNDIFKSPHNKFYKQMSDPKSELTIVIYLKPQVPTKDHLAELSDLVVQHPNERNYLDHKLHQKMTKAQDQAFDAVEGFADHFNLKISDTNKAMRAVTLTANIENFSLAFGVSFAIYQTETGVSHLDYDGVLKLPADLSQYVLTISGLTKGFIKGKRLPIKSEQQHVNSEKGYSPQQIEAAYEFPEVDAKDQCIGIVELGGRYKPSDIEKYCDYFKTPLPEIIEIGSPANNNSPVDDIEVTLDLQMAAGLAPNAKLVIYYAESIPEAILMAISDSKNKPSVLSISWALSESDSSKADIDYLNVLCVHAASLGISIVAASGDYGAYNGKKFLNVMLPASNPYVLGCGGSALYLPSTYETVWFNKEYNIGSGGGYSSIYPVPNYQVNALNLYSKYFSQQTPTTVRGVPDVAANAAIETAYTIVINGQIKKLGSGTSASTPVIAALIARLNQSLGYRLGSFHDFLYRCEGSAVFKQITVGNNGYYNAAPGWSPTTGLGVILGKQLLGAIKQVESK